MVMRRAFADCSQGQVHYRSMHTDAIKTPLVMLHQTASSSLMWEKVMERLGSERPLYALDTPGFGDSFDPDGYVPLDQISNWLVEALDDIGVSNFNIVGHHTGVCLGAEIAVSHAARTNSIMMIGPVPLTQQEREEFREHFSTPFSPDTDGNYLTVTWEYLKGLAGEEAISLELHHRELLDTVRAYNGRYLTYSAVWDQDFTELYQSIKAPILLMCARKDVLWPFFDRAVEMRPDARTAEILGSNFEPDQDPDGVTVAIKSFLDEIES